MIDRDLGPMARAATFRRGLLRWFRLHGRDLPWRLTRDPYRIVVSEFMLQQTQVSRVEGYFHRFLERYPTVEALAAASPLAVRESWEGLGYYRRAANLHRLAQTVVERHGGVVPSDPLVEARCTRIEEQGGSPFMEYLVPAAALSLKQGFGRLIRTARDRGVVALLDSRVRKKGYGKVLLRSLPDARRCHTFAEVEDFWRGQQDLLSLLRKS